MAKWRGERRHRHDDDAVDMNVHRLLDIYALMERHRTRESAMDFELCAVAAEFMALDGAGIALVSDGETFTSLCTSNRSASALMDLELALGEGPDDRRRTGRRD